MRFRAAKFKDRTLALCNGTQSVRTQSFCSSFFPFLYYYISPRESVIIPAEASQFNGCRRGDVTRGHHVRISRWRINDEKKKNAMKKKKRRDFILSGDRWTGATLYRSVFPGGLRRMTLPCVMGSSWATKDHNIKMALSLVNAVHLTVIKRESSRTKCLLNKSFKFAK